MPFGKPNSLTERQALDVAGHMNSQPRKIVHSATMFCATDPTSGLPNRL